MKDRIFVVGAGVLALFMVLFGAAGAWAQATGTVTGTVVNARTNQPMAGVQVVIQETTLGTITDADGTYSITGMEPGTYTVETRSIGYEIASEQVVVGAGRTARADFVLEETAVALEGIVVTGQGTAVEKRKLATTVDVIAAKEIEQVPATDVTQLLQGRVPGATIQAVSAQPGQAANVRFRGITSVVGSQTPVIYIDGVRVDNDTGMGFGTGGESTSALADLLVSDIERVEVIKGGAASTLYGSDAAAGVIQIFTKKGIAGEPRITARIEQGIDTPENKFIKDTEFSFPDIAGTPGNPGNLIRDQFLRDGYFQNYYVNVSGGSSKATYNVSGRVQNAEGIQPKNESTIYSLRGGTTAEVSDELRVDFNGSYTRNQFGRLYNGWSIADPLTTFEVGDALFFSGAETLEEALGIFLLPNIDEEVNRFIFGTTAQYQPSEAFHSRVTVGVDYRASEQRIFEPIEFEAVSGSQGELNRYNRDFSTVTLEAAGTYSWPREGVFTSDLTVGVQGFREDESQIFAEGRDFALPGNIDFDAAANITASEANSEIFNGGIFVQERLGLWDRLFLEGAVRVDGNSAFGEDFGYQLYPKFGAAYTISDEAWWQENLGDYANALKVRVAYGEAGKFPPPFVRDRTFTASPFRGESAPRFENPGNLDLGPEVTATFEAGIDAGLFDNRVGLNLTYYNAVTHDALFFVDEPPATGLRTQLRNVGEITNNGFEAALNLAVLRMQNVDWDITATYNQVDNEVTSLGGVAPFGVGIQGRVAEGFPVGAWYVTFPVDTNGDGLLDDFDRDFVGGQPFPDKTGSVSTALNLFDALTFNALVDWARGGTVIDYGSAWASFNQVPRVVLPTRYDLAGEAVGTFGYGQATNHLLMNGDYTKLREISARYALSPGLINRWGTSSASIFASVRNVYTWVPEDQCLFAEECAEFLVDPELVGVGSASGLQELELGGAQSITLSPPRQFRLGVEVVF